MATKLTHNDYVKRVKGKNSEIMVIGEYVNNREPIDHKCKKCKHVWAVRPDAILRIGTGCPKCNKGNAGQNRLSHETYVKRLSSVSPSISVLGKYVDMSTGILHRHDLCGHTWEAKPLNTVRGRGCPKCKLRMKTVALGKRSVLVRGYEDKALQWLVRNGIPAKDIHVHNEKLVPNVPYEFRGSKHRYFPDFYVPKRKLVLEVKSLATLGLCGNMYEQSQRKLFYMTAAKAKAVKAAGYKFALLLMDEKGNRIETPKNWSSLTHKQMLDLNLGASG